MATNTDLEARLIANPDDDDTWTVYGDWLSEQGDPRGELVAIQREILRKPSATLGKRQIDLIAANPAWLGDLGKLGGKDFAVSWRNGFLESARIGPPADDYESSEIDFPDTIAKLFALPGIQFLRELVIGSKTSDDWPCEWDDCVEALATHPVPAGLRKLAFDHGGYWDISSTSLGSLASIYPKLGNLRELVISMGQYDLTGLDLPELRTLEIISGGTYKKDLETIRTAKLPRLESLSLCLGKTGGDYGGDVELDDLRWIAAGEGLSGVRHLGLANSSLADEIVPLLAGAPILVQLKSLDLSRGTLGEEGAGELVKHADAFRHLDRLDLSQSYLDQGLIQDLRKAGLKIHAEELNPPTDRGERFVSITE